MSNQLSKRERLRFSALAAKEALGTITPTEMKELLRLDLKRDRLWKRSPAGKRYLKQHEKIMERAANILKRLCAMEAQP